MTRPKVVIIGGGFAGLTAARGLRNADVDVTLIDRTNHHLFQPLLYQVATAVLAPSDITSPIRWLLRKNTNTTVLMAEVDSIDAHRQVVQADMGKVEVPYDYLIVASGARHAYFGHDEWEPMAPGLKSLEDALKIRHRFLIAFEEAEKAPEHERESWLRFVIVGGGPTGVELAGILPDIAHHSMLHDFRNFNPRDTKIVLLEGGSRLLTAFEPDLAARALRDLEGLGVEVHLNAVVTRVEKDAVYVGDERIPTRTVLWAAGNQASPLARTLDAPLDRAGRVVVAPDLSVPGAPHIFIAGDLAAVPYKGDMLVPAVAPAANQMGTHAAKNIRRLLAELPTVPFQYVDKGNLATIGRYRAIAEIGRFKLRGQIAWWFWLLIHLMYLATFRNRVIVLIEWAYSYLTYQRGSRLLTESEGDGVSSAGDKATGAVC
ncbi:MAG: NAD(P)/FAD-dependent oxidoreductase [Gemmatimonadaceae bacterium]|nr:NAD(P)/FAD-dependent oxidoreductase [Gemmatimonadaceae bacterium]